MPKRSSADATLSLPDFVANDRSLMGCATPSPARNSIPSRGHALAIFFIPTKPNS